LQTNCCGGRLTIEDEIQSLNGYAGTLSLSRNLGKNSMMDLTETSVWEQKTIKSTLGDLIQVLIRRNPYGIILEEHITMSIRVPNVSNK
jgi:hypothetical protein